MTVLSKVVLAAGEVAPALRARVDSNAYQSGLKTNRNFVVKKTGGIRNRPGTKMIAPCFAPTTQKRLVEFDFGEGDSYALTFGGQDIRFYRNQIQVREVAKVITAATKAAPGVFTCTAHGLSAGDELYLAGEAGMVQINKRSFLAVPINADTFSVTDFKGLPLDTTSFDAFSGGATFARTYRIGSPYAPSELPALSYAQTFDLVKLASGNHNLLDLIRLGHTNWTISNASFSPSIASPTNLVAGSAGAAETWAVTAVKVSTNEESLAATVDGAAASSGSPQDLSWTAVTDAFYYKIYRDDGNGVFGLVGLAGAGASPTFEDKGFNPDVTKTPPGIRGDVLSFGFKLTKLSTPTFPVTNLPGDGRAISWNPLGDMVAVGSASANYLLIYLYQSGAFTLVSAISAPDLPTGPVNGLAWSPDGQFLAAAASPAAGTTRAFIYKRTGQTLALLDPTSYTQPTGDANGVAWSSDSKLVAWAHATTPFVTVHQRSGTTFTKVTNPGTLPTTTAYCVAFTKGAFAQSFTKPAFPEPNPPVIGDTYDGNVFYPGDGSYVAGFDDYFQNIHGLIVGHGNSGGRAVTPYVIVPQFQTATVLLDYVGGFPQPGQNVLSCSIPQGAEATPILTLGLAGGSFVKSYVIGSDPVAKFFFKYVAAGGPGQLNLHYSLQYGGYSFTAVSAPVILPDGAVYGVTDTSNGNFCALATAGTKKLMIYDRIANVLVADAAQFTDVAGNGRAVSWSSDTNFLGIAFDGPAPNAAMYGNSVIQPAVVGFGQQRLRIANTSDGPDVEFDSAQNAYTDFTNRPNSTDRDAIRFRSAGNKLKKIMHLLEMKKLIQLTSSGPMVLQGDASGTITPSVQAPRAAGGHGASYIRPAAVGDDYIYAGANRKTLFSLKKEILNDDYATTDLTVLSAHLFADRLIVAMCYQEVPDTIVWCVMDDGTLVSMTYETSQNIIGFGRHDTSGGTFEDCCCIREPDGSERVYFVVNRGGLRYVEALQDRDNADLVDQYFVDCGVSYDGRNTDPNIAMTLDWDGNPAHAASVACSTPYFQFTDSNHRFRFRDPAGKGYLDFNLTAIFNGQAASGTLVQKIGDGLASQTPTTSWGRLTNTVDGLWHLEGQQVAVLADGFVVSSPLNGSLRRMDGATVVAATPLEVEDGEVTLFDQYYEVVHVGLPYPCDMETLEINTGTPSLVEKTKNLGKVTVKVDRTKGLFFGRDTPADDTVATLTRSHNDDTQDIIGVLGKAANDMLDTQIECTVDGSWDKYGRAFLRQPDPLPVEIVGIYAGVAT